MRPGEEGRGGKVLLRNEADVVKYNALAKEYYTRYSNLISDEEEQDAYILGVDVPVKEFVGKIIAIIHREDDEEEKWVVVPEHSFFTKDEIIEYVRF